VDSGFGTPAIEITVTLQDSSHVEKVLFTKNSENYIAKRENEPQLYQVDSKTVEDLQHAAEQMKNAQSQKP
jgi:hypothetical protein